MTEKQHFLLELKKALDRQQISDADAAPYLERFDRYYERIMAEPENQGGNPLDHVDKIADHIKKQLSEEKEASTPAPTAIEGSEMSDPDTAATITTDTVPPVDDKPETELPPEEIEEPEELPDAGENQSVSAQQKNVRPSGKFWGIFCACLPITIPLALLLVALLGSVYLLGVGLILGALGAMVAVIAVGSILAMIGFVYGVIQLFSETAIGLYEIGLGLVCTGVTMFVGILLYNFAIRLVPFLLKLYTRFVRFVFRKVKELFFYCQRLCGNENV